VRGVVHAALVADDRLGQRTDLEQVVPVGAVASEARDFQAQHDSRVAEADFRDQLLEAAAVMRRAGLSLIAVDGDDVIGRPTEIPRGLVQIVLPAGALGVSRRSVASRTDERTRTLFAADGSR